MRNILVLGDSRKISLETWEAPAGASVAFVQGIDIDENMA